MIRNRNIKTEDILRQAEKLKQEASPRSISCNFSFHAYTCSSAAVMSELLLTDVVAKLSCQGGGNGVYFPSEVKISHMAWDAPRMYLIERPPLK